MTRSVLSPVLQHVRRLAAAAGCAGRADAELVERFVLHHEEAAFETLLKRHGPMVLGVCRRLLAGSADVEDAFQATFLVLARRAASITQRELVGPWLYRVAYHIALKARAAVARRRMREREVATMNPTTAATPDELPDLRAVIDEEVQRLPAKYRLPIVLCYLEGATNEEAARKLRCPPGTVKTRLLRGRELLRRGLTRRGLAPAAGCLAAVLSANLAPAAVPARLLELTALASLGTAAGLAGAASGTVVALANGAIRAMMWSKLKIVLGVCLLAGMLLAGGWFGAHPQGVLPAAAQARGEQPAARKGDDFERLHRMILPQPGELQWMAVPWQTSITVARHEAAVRNKPLVIFADTGAGFADALGLC
jgi:RNA polymerase sigma factor (sigma-70 family)